jgi:hypothetical protein
VIPDEHTPCVACPEIWCRLYANGKGIIQQLDDDVSNPRELARLFAELRDLVTEAAAFVEAHFENQAHSHSPELEAARHPVRPGALVLDRVLPFPGESER